MAHEALRRCHLIGLRTACVVAPSHHLFDPCFLVLATEEIDYAVLHIATKVDAPKRVSEARARIRFNTLARGWRRFWSAEGGAARKLRWNLY